LRQKKLRLQFISAIEMKAVHKSRGILIIISFFIFLIVNKSLLAVSSVVESSRGYSTFLLRNEVINKLGNTFCRPNEDVARTEGDIYCHPLYEDLLSLRSLTDNDIAKWLYFNKEEFSENPRADLFASYCDREQLVNNETYPSKASITQEAMVFFKGGARQPLLQSKTIENSENRFNVLCFKSTNISVTSLRYLLNAFERAQSKDALSYMNETGKNWTLELDGSSSNRRINCPRKKSSRHLNGMNGSTIQILNEKTLRFHGFISDAISNVAQPICFDMEIETGSLVEIFTEAYNGFKIMGFVGEGRISSILLFQYSKELSRINVDSIFCGNAKFDFNGKENLQIQQSNIKLDVENGDAYVVMADKIHIHLKISRLINCSKLSLNFELIKIEGDVNLDGLTGGITGTIANITLYEQISFVMKMEGLERRAVVLSGGRLSAAYLVGDESEKCWVLKPDSLDHPQTLTSFFHS